MKDPKLIVGLANPGSVLNTTRHNAGSWFITFLAEHHCQVLRKDRKFHGYTSKISLEGKDILLLLPAVYMNESGKAVSAIANYYRFSEEEILIAHDELDLQPGMAKFKYGGGHNGHNGLRDIGRSLGNNLNFHRLRIGIGRPLLQSDVVPFVLGKPSDNERNSIYKVALEAVSCISVWLCSGRSEALNKLHSYRGSE
jgi:PTH1 family peptidyl-tRNA hydrolase